MTENKRFKSRVYEKENNIVIYDNNGQKLLDVSYRDLEDAYYLKRKLIPIIDKFNELADENEQLKTQLQNTSDQRDEFHRGARENANRVGKLEKENEQLKQQNENLLAKLKFTAEQLNYSENLRKMFDGDVE